MNKRELAFCAHYHVNRDAAAAAEAAGFSTNSNSQPWKVLRRPHVQEQLNFLSIQAAQVIALDKGVVVNELGAVALTRADEYMKVDDRNRYVGKRPEELNERQRAAVKEIKTRDVFITDLEGNRVFSHQEYRYIMHDKMQALYKLGDHFGLDAVGDPNKTNPFENMPQDQLEALTNAMRKAQKQVQGEVVSG